MTYNALLALDRNGVLTLNQHFNFRTQIQFLVTSDQLFQYLEKHLDYNTLVKVLLRT